MAQQGGSRVCFVGNIPYDMTEEELIQIFSQVGTVVGMRLVFDRETGKPKGYGFCEFADAETAASAYRNLQDTDVRGRPLRIDYAELDETFQGRTTQKGQIDAGGPGGGRSMGRGGGRGGGGGGPSRGGLDQGWGSRNQNLGNVAGPSSSFPPAGAPPQFGQGFQSNSTMTGQLPNDLPQGKPLPNGVSSGDAITQTLAALPPGQLLDIMSQMKSLVSTSPEQARTLLTSHPQLAYALFQAMLMMNIVDQPILQRILIASGASGGVQAGGMGGAGAGGGGGTSKPPLGPSSNPYSNPPHFNNPHGNGTPPHHQANPYQQPNMYSNPGVATHPPPPVQPQPGARPPIYGQQPQSMPPGPPPPHHQPQQQQQQQQQAIPGANLGEEQRALLMQVLQLTPDQINALPPDQRASILQLKAQMGHQ